MEPMADVSKSSALPEFCAAVVNRHAAAWPPAEDQLAREFRTHFEIARLAFFDGIVKWCNEVGIVVSTMDCFPHDLRGANFWHDKNMSIMMPPYGGCVISREHTLLHEVRELLERLFSQIGYPTSEGAALETRAEQFAACVRIAVFLESSKDFFQLAGTVKNPLGRVGAFGLVGTLTVAAVVGSAGIRQLEAQFEALQARQST